MDPASAITPVSGESKTTKILSYMLTPKRAAIGVGAISALLLARQFIAPPPGIRKEYPTNYGEFEGMKPHPGTDFPGGRLQPFWGKETALEYISRMKSILTNEFGLEGLEHTTPLPKNTSGMFRQTRNSNVRQIIGLETDSMTTRGQFLSFNEPFQELVERGDVNPHILISPDLIDNSIMNVYDSGHIGLYNTVRHESIHYVDFAELVRGMFNKEDNPTQQLSNTITNLSWRSSTNPRSLALFERLEDRALRAQRGVPPLTEHITQRMAHLSDIDSLVMPGIIKPEEYAMYDSIYDVDNSTLFRNSDWNSAFPENARVWFGHKPEGVVERANVPDIIIIPGLRSHSNPNSVMKPHPGMPGGVPGAKEFFSQVKSGRWLGAHWGDLTEGLAHNTRGITGVKPEHGLWISHDLDAWRGFRGGQVSRYDARSIEDLRAFTIKNASSVDYLQSQYGDPDGFINWRRATQDFDIINTTPDWLRTGKSRGTYSEQLAYYFERPSSFIPHTSFSKIQVVGPYGRVVGLKQHDMSNVHGAIHTPTGTGTKTTGARGSPIAIPTGGMGIVAIEVAEQAMLATSRNSGQIFSGMRQSYPTNPNQRQDMKDHPDSDFTAGRAPFNPASTWLATTILSGGVGAGAWLAFKDWNTPSNYEWGRASQFGLGANYMYGNIAPEYDTSQNSMAAAVLGTGLHAQIQERFKEANPNIITEFAIRDPEAKLTGHIDMLIPGISEHSGKPSWTPVEIKTVSNSKLAELRAPREENRAQAQFYMHYLAKQAMAQGYAPPAYEEFIYTSRTDPNNYKIFRLQRSEQEYQFYLARYRAYQREVKATGAQAGKQNSHLLLMGDIIQQSFANQPSTDDVAWSAEDLLSQSHEIMGNMKPAQGINRSNGNAYDFDSPMKHVWNLPSAALAKYGPAQIKSARTGILAPPKTQKLITMKPEGRHRKNGMYRRATRLNYYETTQSRLGSVA